MTKTVEMQTSAGTMRIELDDEKAPLSVRNFLDYVRKGHYDGTVFHRVIKGFMMQGGGFEPGMKQKPTAATDPERGQQRPEQQALHPGHGAHLGAAQRQRSSSSTPPTTASSTSRRNRAGLGLRRLRPRGRRHRRGRCDREGAHRPQRRARRRAGGRGDDRARGRARLRPRRRSDDCRCRCAAAGRRVPGAAGLAGDRFHFRPAPVRGAAAHLRGLGGVHAQHAGRRGRSSSATCSRSGSATMPCSWTSSAHASRCWRMPASAAACRRFMVGNRDFLVAPQILPETRRACPGRPDGAARLVGERVLLTHGDALCLDDDALPALPRLVRDPAYAAAISWRGRWPSG